MCAKRKYRPGSAEESASSSSTYNDHGKGFGPFWAQKESTGVWFIDWFVPTTVTQGQLYDIWSFQWDSSSPRANSFLPLT